MNATTEIMSILSAMGARPVAVVRDQVTQIKVNAPIIGGDKK